MSAISHFSTEQLCAFLERSLPDEAGPEIAAVCALWHREGIHGASFPFDMTDDEWREMVPRLALRLRIKRLFREVNSASSSTPSTPLSALQFPRLPPSSAPAALAPTHYAPAPVSFAPAPERFATPQATGRGRAAGQPAITTPVHGRGLPQYAAPEASHNYVVKTDVAEAKAEELVDATRSMRVGARVPLPVPRVPFAFSLKTVLNLVPVLLKNYTLAPFIGRQKVSTIVDWVKRLLSGWTLSPVSLATTNEDLARDLLEHMLTPGPKGQSRKPCNTCATFYPLGLFYPDMGPITKMVFTSPPNAADMMVSSNCVLCETERLRKLGVHLPHCPPGLVPIPEDDTVAAAGLEHSPAMAVAEMQRAPMPPVAVYSWPDMSTKRKVSRSKRERPQETVPSLGAAADASGLENAGALKLQKEQQQPVEARKSQRVVKESRRAASPFSAEEEDPLEKIPKVQKRKKRRKAPFAKHPRK